MLRCDGSTITALDDGATLRTVTDTSITSAGYAGMGMGAIITATDDTSSQKLDTFTVQTLSSSSGVSTRYVHGDHLGGMNVTSDENGIGDEVVDFHPYGTERLRLGETQDQRQYAGTERDTESNLDYMVNRYYSSMSGQFLGQDAVHRALGNSKEIQGFAGRGMEDILLDPQLMNSYAYGRGNPVRFKDPEGNIAVVPFIALAYSLYSGAQLAIDAYDVYQTNYKYGDVFSQAEKNQTNFKAGYDFVLTATGAKIGRDLGKAAEVGFDTLTSGMDVIDTYFSEQAYRHYNANRNTNHSQVVRGSNSYQQSTPGGTSNAYAPSNQGVNQNYNQLVNQLSQIVSTLQSYVSSLSGDKNKK